MEEYIVIRKNELKEIFIKALTLDALDRYPSGENDLRTYAVHNMIDETDTKILLDAFNEEDINDIYENHDIHELLGAIADKIIHDTLATYEEGVL